MNTVEGKAVAVPSHEYPKRESGWTEDNGGDHQRADRRQVGWKDYRPAACLLNALTNPAQAMIHPWWGAHRAGR
ncbi:DNA circularization N-terminal domain-containing protein [Aeromonas hydrophila]|uniref:DNA circularization N-terminal domain-containing protein n=1 Tax=Aeromonas hydrophila TaxID=644 RepID=A0A926FI20_AERHY|nr:DNA circularization N-terminal domain-containing protein [Aeromonas hydrophila]